MIEISTFYKETVYLAYSNKIVEKMHFLDQQCERVIYKIYFSTLICLVNRATISVPKPNASTANLVRLATISVPDAGKRQDAGNHILSGHWKPSQTRKPATISVPDAENLARLESWQPYRFRTLETLPDSKAGNHIGSRRWKPCKARKLAIL